MADTNVTVLVRLKDELSKELGKLSGNLEKADGGAGKFKAGLIGLGAVAASVTIAMGALANLL